MSEIIFFPAIIFKDKYVDPYISAQISKEDQMVICNHQADKSLYMWPDVSWLFAVLKKVWSYMYMILSVLTETKCH